MTYEERIKACLSKGSFVDQESLDSLFSLLTDVRQEGYDEGYDNCRWDHLDDR